MYVVNKEDRRANSTVCKINYLQTKLREIRQKSITNNKNFLFVTPTKKNMKLWRNLYLFLLMCGLM